MSDAVSEPDRDHLKYLVNLLTALRQAGDKVAWKRREDSFHAVLAGKVMYLSATMFTVEENEGGVNLFHWHRPKEPAGTEAIVAGRLTSLYWRVRRQVALGEGALPHLLAAAQALAEGQPTDTPDEPQTFPSVGAVATVNEGTFKGKRVIVVHKDGYETRPADQTKVVLPVSQLAVWLPIAHLTFDADEPQVMEKT